MDKFKGTSIIIIVLLLITKYSFQEEEKFKCEGKDSFEEYDEYFSSNQKICKFRNIQSTIELQELSKIFYKNHSDVDHLSFVNSTLKAFPGNFFAPLKQLKKLQASNISLEELQSNLFANLKKMYEIDFSNNKLKSISDETFKNLKTLSIDFSENEIETIHENAFKGAFISSSLSFMKNKIKSLHFLDSMEYFLSAELNDNFIEHFEELRLESFNWTAANMFGNPSFYISNNQFKEFNCPQNFKIDTIFLNNNTQLTTVNVNECQMNEISLTDCSILHHIEFKTPLKTLIAGHTRIQTLQIDNSIENLDVTNASLSQEMLNQILNLPKLNSLELSGNYIGPVNFSTFKNLIHLTQLIMRDTNISNIQTDTFLRQLHLKVLDLSDNQLGHFDMKVVQHLIDIETIRLSGNNLNNLENFANFNLRNMAEINLSNNSFTCRNLLNILNGFKQSQHWFFTFGEDKQENSAQLRGINCIQNIDDDTEILPSYNEDVSEMLIKIIKHIDGLHSKFDELKPSLGQILMYILLIVVCVSITIFITMKNWPQLRRLGNPNLSFSRQVLHVRMDSIDAQNHFV